MRHDARLIEDGPLPRLEVTTPLASASVFLQGAHVTAWTPAHASEPVLWMSARSAFEAGRPIRGGVPICCPWFGPHPSQPDAPAHGLARISEWTSVDAPAPAESGALAFVLEDVPSPLWPRGLRLVHRVTI